MCRVPDNTPAELINLINWIDIDKIPLNQQATKLTDLDSILAKYKIPLRKKPFPRRDERIEIPDRLLALIEKYDVTAFPGYRLVKPTVLKRIQSYIYKNFPTKG